MEGDQRHPDRAITLAVRGRGDRQDVPPLMPDAEIAGVRLGTAMPTPRHRHSGAFFRAHTTAESGLGARLFKVPGRRLMAVMA